jgi:hypothetical protein
MCASSTKASELAFYFTLEPILPNIDAHLCCQSLQTRLDAPHHRKQLHPKYMCRKCQLKDCNNRGGPRDSTNIHATQASAPFQIVPAEENLETQQPPCFPKQGHNSSFMFLDLDKMLDHNQVLVSAESLNATKVPEYAKWICIPRLRCWKDVQTRGRTDEIYLEGSSEKGMITIGLRMQFLELIDLLPQIAVSTPLFPARLRIWPKDEYLGLRTYSESFTRSISISLQESRLSRSSVVARDETMN